MLLVYNNTDDILTILPQSEIARAELITSDNDDEIIGSDSEYINQIVSDQTDITQIPINEPRDKWPISALKGELKEKLPSNVVVLLPPSFKLFSIRVCVFATFTALFCSKNCFKHSLK